MYTTQTLLNNTLLSYQTVANMSSYATQSWVTSQNYLSSALMSNYMPLTGGIITDTGYNNTPLKIYFTANGVANSYSQDYIAITTNGGSYGGSFAGGIQQMVGGYFTLNTINGGTGTTYMMCIAGNMYILTSIFKWVLQYYS